MPEHDAGQPGHGALRPGSLTGLAAGVAVRAGLDRATILHEAVKFIDEQGTARLTMRRLGAQLGVQAMALYHYISSREQILEGVGELFMQEVSDQTHGTATFDTWQPYLRHTAQAIRDAALLHPAIFVLLSTRPSAVAGLRPPLDSPDWVERFLAQLAGHGFGSDGSAVTYRALCAFLVGQLLPQASGSAPNSPSVVQKSVASDGSATGEAGYPRINEMAAKLAGSNPHDEFDSSLEDFIRRVRPSTNE